MNINWKMTMHVNADTEHVLTYRDSALGVQVDVVTAYKDGRPGKCTNHFHIDGDKRVFKSEKELIEAIKKE